MPSGGKRPAARATDLVGPKGRVGNVLTVEEVVHEGCAVGGEVLLGEICHGAMSQGAPRSGGRDDGKHETEHEADEDGHGFRKAKSGTRRD